MLRTLPRLSAGSRQPSGNWRGDVRALEGEPSRAAALVAKRRRQGDIGGVDILLAEKVIGAGAEARAAATIDWEDVDSLNPWRFGLAGATGAELPRA